MQTPSALIIGAGVVGRATASVLTASGFVVSAYDVDDSALDGFPAEPVKDSTRGDWSVIAICVPTPTVDGRMSSAHLGQAMERTVTKLRGSTGFTAVAVRSTIVPGTMEAAIAPAISREFSSDRAGMCHWPSFGRERRAVDDEACPRAVVFGTDGNPLVNEAMARCVRSVDVPVSWVSFVEAELIKHGANAFNALKISYFNAVADWTHERGGSGQDVADAIGLVAEGNWNPKYATTVGSAFGGKGEFNRWTQR